MKSFIYYKSNEFNYKHCTYAFAVRLYSAQKNAFYIHIIFQQVFHNLSFLDIRVFIFEGAI